MTVRAYILIETSVDISRRAGGKLGAIPGVRSVDIVPGPYDIIAVVEVADLRAVGDLITTDIHMIDGIIRTVTCLSIGGGLSATTDVACEKAEQLEATRDLQLSMPPERGQVTDG